MPPADSSRPAEPEFGEPEFGRPEFSRHWGRQNWNGRRRPLWLPVVISVITQFITVAMAVHAAQPLLIAAAAASFCASFLLFASRTAPGPMVAAIALLCTPAIALIGGPPIAGVPLVFAVVIAIHSGSRVWVWSALAGVALIGGVGGYLLVASPWVSVRVLIVVIALCLVVAFAETARGRRERYRAAAAEVASRRQTAAEAERLRIARELHDVLAHSLSQISVQAGVGLHLFDTQPTKARESLAIIKETSGSALDEVRGVLGMLRADGEQPDKSPGPDLARLPELIRTSAEAGLRVTLENHLSDDAVPTAIQLVVYRVVQEALTNVIRHSGAKSATVVLAADTRAFRVVVTDAGPATVRTRAPGRGLIGMRERVELIGGSVWTGANDDGGYRVVAELPHEIDRGPST